MSLLEQANTSLFAKKWVWAGLIILCGLGFFGYRWYIAKTNIPELQSISVQKNTIISAVEVDGKLEHASSLSMTFGSNGKIQKHLVQEGDRVTKGQKLAELERDTIELDLQKAKVNVAIAQANLNAKKAGSTVEDITIAAKNIDTAVFDLKNTENTNRLSVESAKIAWEQAEKKLELAQKNIDVKSTTQTLDVESAQRAVKNAEQNLLMAQNNKIQNRKNLVLEESQAYEKAQLQYLNSLSIVDAILREAYLALEIDKNPGYGMGYLYSGTNENLRIEAKNEYTRLYTVFSTTTNADLAFTPDLQSEVIAELEKRILLLQDSQRLITMISQGYNDTIESATLSSERISALKNNVLSQESKLATQLSSLLTAIQSLQTVSISFAKQELSDDNAIIVAEQKLADAIAAVSKTDTSGNSATILDEDSIFALQKQAQTAKAQYDNALQKQSVSEDLAKTKIEIAKAQWQALKNGVRAVDIAALAQQVKTAELALQQAQSLVHDTIIIAPTDGIIAQTNYEDGDFFQNGPSAKPVFVLVSEHQFEMKAFVDEADIAQIVVGQDAEITFDALDGIKTNGNVVFISSVPSTDANGVVTYPVTIRVGADTTIALKEGMTSYASIILKKAENVLVIPNSYILSDNGSEVILVDGTKKKITLGLTDGKMTEVISGLTAGDIIQKSNNN